MIGSQLKQFHIDHNYYVSIRALDQMMGCSVHFPPNLLQKLDEMVCTYIIDDSYDNIEIFCITKDQKFSKNVNTKKINTRLLIMEDILLRSVKRNMSKDLIFIDDNEKNDSIFEILGVKLTMDDLQLEKELCQLFLKLLEGKAVSKEIKDPILYGSYAQLQECFENGGL